MKLLAAGMVIFVLFVILLFIRREKTQTLESFTLGDFLQQNEPGGGETGVLDKIAHFLENFSGSTLNGDGHESGDSEDTDDGGE